MKIYLAASYSRREELCGYRKKIRSLGYEVVSRWLDGNHQVPDSASGPEADALRARFANEDIQDLAKCDLLISFTGSPDGSPSTEGRHVELGYAIGSMTTCICVGPKENDFHYYRFIRFMDSPQAFFDYLERNKSWLIKPKVSPQGQRS